MKTGRVIKRWMGAVLACVLAMAGAGSVFAESYQAMDLAMNPDAGVILFPGDSICGLDHPAYLNYNHEQPLELVDGSSWTNVSAEGLNNQAYQVSYTPNEEMPEEAWYDIVSVGYILTVTDGTSRLLYPDGMPDNHHFGGAADPASQRTDRAWYPSGSAVALDAFPSPDGVQILQGFEAEGANVDILWDDASACWYVIMPDQEVRLKAVYVDPVTEAQQAQEGDGADGEPTGGEGDADAYADGEPGADNGEGSGYDEAAGYDEGAAGGYEGDGALEGGEAGYQEQSYPADVQFENYDNPEANYVDPTLAGNSGAQGELSASQEPAVVINPENVDAAVNGGSDDQAGQPAAITVEDQGAVQMLTPEGEPTEEFRASDPFAEVEQIEQNGPDPNAPVGSIFDQMDERSLNVTSSEVYSDQENPAQENPAQADGLDGGVEAAAEEPGTEPAAVAEGGSNQESAPAAAEPDAEPAAVAEGGAIQENAPAAAEPDAEPAAVAEGGSIQENVSATAPDVSEADHSADAEAAAAAGEEAGAQELVTEKPESISENQEQVTEKQEPAAENQEQPQGETPAPAENQEQPQGETPAPAEGQEQLQEEAATQEQVQEAAAPTQADVQEEAAPAQADAQEQGQEQTQEAAAQEQAQSDGQQQIEGPTAQAEETPKAAAVKVSFSNPADVTVTGTDGTAYSAADGVAVPSGTVLNLTANTSGTNRRFTSWSAQGDNTGATFSAQGSAATQLTVGTADVVVTANYIPICEVTVTSGSGSGQYAQGDQVTIQANKPSKGWRFDHWTVVSGSAPIADIFSSKTSFTMPGEAVKVRADYEMIEYTLTVSGGKGSGKYTMDEEVSLEADWPAEWKEFDKWVITSGHPDLTGSDRFYATLTMPASDASVKSVYKDGPNPAYNAITGLENGVEYLKGITLSFHAAGVGMDNTSPNPGDYRYKPTGYQIGSVSGGWQDMNFTTSMAINAVGDYTLSVTFTREVYRDGAWVSDGTVDTKSVSFHVVNALSVQTGDTSPIMALVMTALTALAVIMLILTYRRRSR